MRPSVGRGRGVRFSPATAPSTPAIVMRGTLDASNLRVVGSSGGSQLADRLAEKLPAEEPSPPTTKAEATASDAAVGRRGTTRRIRTTYANKDPREIMKTLRQGNRNFIDKFDELLDGMEVQLEVRDHSPSPKHFGGQKMNFLAG